MQEAGGASSCSRTEVPGCAWCCPPCVRGVPSHQDTALEHSREPQRPAGHCRCHRSPWPCRTAWETLCFLRSFPLPLGTFQLRMLCAWGTQSYSHVTCPMQGKMAAFPFTPNAQLSEVPSGGPMADQARLRSPPCRQQRRHLLPCPFAFPPCACHRDKPNGFEGPEVTATSGPRAAGPLPPVGPGERRTTCRACPSGRARSPARPGRPARRPRPHEPHRPPGGTASPSPADAALAPSLRHHTQLSKRPCPSQATQGSPAW